MQTKENQRKSEGDLKETKEIQRKSKGNLIPVPPPPSAMGLSGLADYLAVWQRSKLKIRRYLRGARAAHVHPILG